MLRRMAGGDEDARREAFDLLYDPMRRIAGALLRREARDCSLGVTELVHEAIANKLSGPLPRVADREHFLSITAIVMRWTLVDRARRRFTRQRFETSFKEQHSSVLAPDWMLTIRREMGLLAEIDPRAASIVIDREIEQKTWEETAAAAGVSVRKARADYDFAIAWLRGRLRA